MGKYYACKNVVKALELHIQDVSNDRYLETLMNEDTQLIQEDIPMVLKYLFNTYNVVPIKEIKEQNNKI